MILNLTLPVYCHHTFSKQTENRVISISFKNTHAFHAKKLFNSTSGKEFIISYYAN
jgi:hypothetical protein